MIGKSLLIDTRTQLDALQTRHEMNDEEQGLVDQDDSASKLELELEDSETGISDIYFSFDTADDVDLDM